MDSLAALGALGIGETEQLLYRLLLRRRADTAAELAEELGVPAARAQEALRPLETVGLVTSTVDNPPSFVPTAPDVGIEALISLRRAELDGLRVLAVRLMAEYRQGAASGRTDLVEVLSGPRAVLNRFDLLQRSAVAEILVLDTPPYAGDAGPITNDVEFEVLARGVVCRAIYDRAALDRSPKAVEAIARYVAAGEQARVTNQLPFKLAIFDRKVAFVPGSLDQPDIAAAIVVYESSLLGVLTYVFEQLWTNAIAIAPDPPHLPPSTSDDPTPEHRRLLALLTSGMKDEAIAHHLGWSYRTTRRRIAELLRVLGAETRFQAGIAATRRGWI
ncbi:helix-turn-helix domain-containing protein [Allorhizocola rhizosphaerae]|uniref:helix-turn-helix domain-containing protein n=1 Tax=Allorhizocola rhizosphaerae TaxID=1872709 RepID=UPI0013C2A8BE|nr:helix-turn-helix domain-containing protein [Allorhizocola rhizosphaerae]